MNKEAIDTEGELDSLHVRSERIQRKVDDLEQKIEPETRTMRQRQQRPKVVTLIALSQFLKAVLILIVAMILLEHPDRKFISVAFREFFYATTNGSGLPGILSLIAILYSAIVGIGLWHMRRWARNVLLLTTGATVALWLKYFLFNSILKGTSWHNSIPEPGFQQESVVALILIDTLILCCLTLYPGVAEAFGKNEP